RVRCSGNVTAAAYDHCSRRGEPGLNVMAYVKKEFYVVVDELPPDVEQRWYVRHIEPNWHQTWKVEL
ncbi:hypothetical protein HAX54_044607, partial [Datura stramonium]|nr:hypothetical protein [Datura stramonium]